MIFPKESIQNQIISVLSDESPLSFKKISVRLKKISSASTRTIYRTLEEMTTEEILINEDGEFLINEKWLDNLEIFKDKVVKNYIKGDSPLINKQRIYSLAKERCSCEKGYAEGFCFLCNESVCSDCGEKVRMHYSCSDECENCDDNAVGKCANCLKDVCLDCSKEVWVHFSENISNKNEKVVVGILEVDHQCWFADLSEKLENPIVLNSFIDAKDKKLGTHSGQIVIDITDKKTAINELLKHKQIVEVKPIYANEKLILRTRALFDKSVDEFVRKNKSILLNPIEANDTKERNLIISPSKKEINNLINGLREYGNCRLIAHEEIAIQKIASPSSREIKAFVQFVNKEDLNNAVQKMRLMKKFYE